MATNKELALAWFQALVSGDAQTVASGIADDFRYFLTGTMPASGWWDKQGFFDSAKMFAGVLAGPITMRIGDVTAEDDRVWIEAESEAPLSSGGTYLNTYVMALKVRDGKIAEMKEFSDTLHVFEAIDAPETRGPRKPRETPLTTVTASIQGPTAGPGMT
ncbi:nuclear transport factor 2 family protein [Mycobacterium sp.]|uniref:nuclear transport factor 2 family protein n=1 Tax=Mycobacterium sp. TaxID=1785 RepID=UPI003C74BD8C